MGGTALLLNGQAVTFLAQVQSKLAVFGSWTVDSWTRGLCDLLVQGKYPEAETALGEAIEKDPNNPETLVNMIVLAQHQVPT